MTIFKQHRFFRLATILASLVLVQTTTMAAQMQASALQVSSTLPSVGELTSAMPLQERPISLDQAVAMVEAKYKSKALRYNTIEEEGRQVHYIRLITADRARVFTIRIDAATGRELPSRE